MKHPIPSDALDDRLFFGGTAGSGKTYNSGSCVERLMASGARVGVIDPLGVWWGLALKADGETPSMFRSKEKLVIFGGPRGDLPLNEHAGALIGETVANMAESFVLDLSEIGTRAGERRFMLAFLSALYKHKTKEPLHVVFDEADMWAPQKIMDRDGDAARLYGMMETVVRRGRIKGFIPWLITQRPAVIAKDILSQVDGLAQWAVAAGLKRTGGTWSTYVSRLRTGAYIETRGDQFYATAAGIQAAGTNVQPVPPPGPQRVEFWARKLAGVRPMLSYLMNAYPDYTSRQALADGINLAAGGGTFSTYLSRLRSPGLIEENGSSLRLSADVMG